MVGVLQQGCDCEPFSCSLASLQTLLIHPPPPLSSPGRELIAPTTCLPQSTPLSVSKSILHIARGGARPASSSVDTTPCPMRTFTTLVASLYGTGGVMYMLIKAIRRVVPIALEPFGDAAVPMTQFQLWYVDNEQNVLDTMSFFTLLGLMMII